MTKVCVTSIVGALPENPSKQRILNLSKLANGVEAWNVWRKQNREVVLDLSETSLTDTNLAGADLSEVDLSGVSAQGADLHGANLQGARLCNADLRCANLRNTCLNEADLRKGKLCDADMTGANVAKANLNRADLARADLRRANAKKAKLKKASLVEANLGQANFESSNLTDAHVFTADLRNVNMNGATLVHCNFYEADLRNAQLVGAKLWGVEFYESNLMGANLTDANLWLCRLIRCDLSEAIVENAVVTDLQISELKGKPVQPSVLRLDTEGHNVLYGKHTNAIFDQPAILEVHINLHLSEMQLACYQLYVVELHRNRVAMGVHFTGQRHEGPHTILGFQAANYETIYSALPNLLAPLPRAQAVDWGQTMAALPQESMSEDMMAFVRKGTVPRAMTWPLAERLAQFFVDFRNALVMLIHHAGHGLHSRVDVAHRPEDAVQTVASIPPEQRSDEFLIVPLETRSAIDIVGRGRLKAYADDNESDSDRSNEPPPPA